MNNYLWLFTLSCFLAAGCGSNSGPKVYPLTGQVTLDGKPLPAGNILLQDPAREERNYIAIIKDGVITGTSTPGEKRVSITAIRPAKEKKELAADGSGDYEATTEQYLPEKYNTRSTLTVQIKPSNDNVLNFDLSSR